MKPFLPIEQLHPFPQLRQKFIGLVGCGKDKMQIRCAARTMYTNPITRIPIEWIARNCHTWRIVSAMYGIVPPEKELEPYDLALQKVDRKARRSLEVDITTNLKELGGPFLCILQRRYIRIVEKTGLPFVDLYMRIAPLGSHVLLRELQDSPLLTPEFLTRLEK